jgi:hypothetical protein
MQASVEGPSWAWIVAYTKASAKKASRVWVATYAKASVEGPSWAWIVAYAKASAKKAKRVLAEQSFVSWAEDSFSSYPYFGRQKIAASSEGWPAQQTGCSFSLDVSPRTLLFDEAPQNEGWRTP